MDKIKLYTIYTDEESKLKDIFMRSLKDNWEVTSHHFQLLEKGEGDFGTQSFIHLIRKRTEYFLNRIKDNQGKIIILSDIDIQFFGRCTSLIKRIMKYNDIVFLAEHWPRKKINGGFIVVNCNDKTVSFFKQVLEMDFEQFKFFEQTAMDNLLQENKIGLRWDILPKQFWAKSHGGQPPADILLHHANCTLPVERAGTLIRSLDLKLEQMLEVKYYIKRKRRYKILKKIKKVLLKLYNLIRKYK